MLKKRVDDFIEQPIKNLFIDPELIAFGMSTDIFIYESKWPWTFNSSLVKNRRNQENGTRKEKQGKPICAVFLEDLRSDTISPHVITCGHVFCQICVKDILKGCYICSQPINQAEDAKKNFWLKFQFILLLIVWFSLY